METRKAWKGRKDKFRGPVKVGDIYGPDSKDRLKAEKLSSSTLNQ